MSEKAAINDLIDWAVKTRYDQTPEGVLHIEQRQADALEVMQILRKHDIEVVMDYAMQEIPAPAVLPYDGRCPHGKLNREFCEGCHPRPTMVVTRAEGWLGDGGPLCGQASWDD